MKKTYKRTVTKYKSETGANAPVSGILDFVDLDLSVLLSVTNSSISVTLSLVSNDSDLLTLLFT